MNLQSKEQDNLKWVEGYEGLYKVSSEGIVYSFNRYNGKPMALCTNTHGYYEINLCKNKVCTKHRIHRIVAQAFVPNPNNLPMVNHIDGDKTNNNADNLEWVSAKDNIIHSYENLLNTKQKAVEQVDTNSNNVIGLYRSTMEAERKTGVAHNSIVQVCKGKRKSAGGFAWRYANNDTIL